MADLIFNDFLEELFKGNIDLDGDTFKAIILDNTYTPDASDHDYADVSAYELETGSGYTAGGEALSQSVAETDGTVTFDADDITWTTATFTGRYVVIFDDTHDDDLLVCLLDMDEDKTGLGDNFIARFNALGVIYAAQA
jgi:hypothetical protein